MSILDFINMFHGYVLSLSFMHVDVDENRIIYPRYSYIGFTQDFKTRMCKYDWLFAIFLSDPAVVRVDVNNPYRTIVIDIDYKNFFMES